jgi:hypothetical protein
MNIEPSRLLLRIIPLVIAVLVFPVLLAGLFITPRPGQAPDASLGLLFGLLLGALGIAALTSFILGRRIARRLILPEQAAEFFAPVLPAGEPLLAYTKGARRGAFSSPSYLIGLTPHYLAILRLSALALQPTGAQVVLPRAEVQDVTFTAGRLREHRLAVRLKAETLTLTTAPKWIGHGQALHTAWRSAAQAPEPAHEPSLSTHLARAQAYQDLGLSLAAEQELACALLLEASVAADARYQQLQAELAAPKAKLAAWMLPMRLAAGMLGIDILVSALMWLLWGIFNQLSPGLCCWWPFTVGANLLVGITLLGSTATKVDRARRIALVWAGLRLVYWFWYFIVTGAPIAMMSACLSVALFLLLIHSPSKTRMVLACLLFVGLPIFIVGILALVLPSLGR